MMRPWLLGGVLACVLCAHAQAQIETVVVTASVAGPRAEKLLVAASHRLTPDGKIFVEREAKQFFDGAIDAGTVRSDAGANCATAFESCGSRDGTVLAALAFGSLSSVFLPEVHALFSGIPQAQLDHMSGQMQACEVRNDAKCAQKVLLQALPADRHQTAKLLLSHMRRARQALNETLASLGIDEKGDQ